MGPGRVTGGGSGSPDAFPASPQISAESVALWINTVVGASTLFGLWALGILFRQARTHLTEQNIQAKFTCFQVSPSTRSHSQRGLDVGQDPAVAETQVQLRVGTVSSPWGCCACRFSSS